VTNSNLESLRAVPIFSALDDAALGRIASIAAEFDARAGHVLIEPGQASMGVFIVEEGSVTVELASGERIERGPGSVIGELSIFAGTTRTARVSAASDITCIALRRDDLMGLLETEPTIAIALLGEVARRLIEAT
jgi:CRP-like cAMP-binding protein